MISTMAIPQELMDDFHKTSDSITTLYNKILIKFSCKNAQEVGLLCDIIHDY